MIHFIKEGFYLVSATSVVCTGILLKILFRGALLRDEHGLFHKSSHSVKLC